MRPAPLMVRGFLLSERVENGEGFIERTRWRV
jgi:hypothetical protein